jgi:DNA-binding MarR family transcriptional regulator
MNVELGSRIMQVLSSRLSVSLADLKKLLPAAEGEVEEALKALESEQYIHQSPDSVTGSTLISPTSKGILAARGLSKYAFKSMK